MHTVNHRRGAVLIWALPALAVVVAATVWWLTPGRSATDRSLSGPHPSTTDSGAIVVPRIESAPQAASDRDVSQRPDSPSTSSSSPANDVVVKKLSDRTEGEIKQALAGEWSGYYQGRREMKVAADETGTMVSHPEGLAATFLAAKLTFKFRWTLNGDQLEFETVGGEPADKVNVVVQMYGRRRSHQILKLQANEMVLLDEDGETKYVWKRVTGNSKPETSPEK